MRLNGLVGTSSECLIATVCGQAIRHGVRIGRVWFVGGNRRSIGLTQTTWIAQNMVLRVKHRILFIYAMWGKENMPSRTLYGTKIA